jgi:multimeric flavodoxin WrbA
MKILAIQGSPKTDGNTQALLDLALASAREAGAEAEVVELVTLENLTGCMECQRCQTFHDRPGCAIDDDMQSVHAKALQSDVIVWATPVFCVTPTWLAKMAMDRFYCMFKFRPDGSVRSLLAGKKSAAVITAGGTETDGAEVVEQVFQRSAIFAQTEWLGTLLATETTTPDQILSDALLVEQARDFGRRLAS